MFVFQIFKILIFTIIFFLLFRLLMFLLNEGKTSGRKRSDAGERERREQGKGVIELGKDQYKVE